VNDSTKTMYDTDRYIALRFVKTGASDVIASPIREEPDRIADDTIAPGSTSFAVSDEIRIPKKIACMIRQSVQPVIQTTQARSPLITGAFFGRTGRGT